MARKLYRYPPRPSSGAGTFSDNIVGFQVVDGGGLTQGNFEFTSSLSEKVDRTFSIGAFSAPITLDNLQIESVAETKAIVAKEFGVYPNFDLSNVTKFSTYGPLTKRIAASITQILNYFPAAVEVYALGGNFVSGYTAVNIEYDIEEDTTTFSVPLEKSSNPFEVDYTVNSTRNIATKEFEVSYLRNMTLEYSKYAVYVKDVQYPILNMVPTTNFTTGYLNLTVAGKPFSGDLNSYEVLVIKPNDYYTEVALTQPFDEIEKYLLNRLVTPRYTAIFQVPKQNDDGTTYVGTESVTWPLSGVWNLDISTNNFTSYITQLNQIATNFDASKTNLISRFLVTDSFKEFDTSDQRVEKVLNIYGRSFDEVKKFIDALAYMNSVNYNTKNDIPSELLKNLSQTLGWNINVSPVTEEDFLKSVFGNNTKSPYPGMSRSLTPSEINYQFYKNLILNSAYLFKSKGTRRALEFLLRLVGAPEALIEFNETIYLADQKINMRDFNTEWAKISGGTKLEETIVFNPNDTFSIFGQTFSGYSATTNVVTVDALEGDYPIDSEGYPKTPPNTSSFFFQLGAGWYELTPPHQSNQDVSETQSVFTGQNTNVQTDFKKFTYGQQYLDRFRNFPYMDLGFKLKKISDNKKSWSFRDKSRISNEGGFNAFYYTDDERLVLNVKNIDLFMNPAAGLIFDVWSMSSKYGYPIPNTPTTQQVYGKGLTTATNVPPNKQTFFEFANSFWQNKVNVANRQVSSGYDDVSLIYWRYLESASQVGIPNDNFTYQKLIDYVKNLGAYWPKLAEQLIPSSTIWNTGIKYNNAPFQRQKHTYKIPRSCSSFIPPTLCKPCIIDGDLFLHGACQGVVTFPIFPWLNGTTSYTSFQSLLNEIIFNYVSDKISQGYTCNQNSVSTTWKMVVALNGTDVISNVIYNGNGPSDVPTNSDWTNALNQYLPNLSSYGYTFEIIDSNVLIKYLGFNPLLGSSDIEIKLNVDFSISCS
jgi:hypothetical protein